MFGSTKIPSMQGLMSREKSDKKCLNEVEMDVWMLGASDIPNA